MPVVQVSFVLILYNSNGRVIGTHRTVPINCFLDVGVEIMGMGERWVFRNLKSRFLEVFPLQLGSLGSFDIFHIGKGLFYNILQYLFVFDDNVCLSFSLVGLNLVSLEGPSSTPKVTVISDNRGLIEILRQKYWESSIKKDAGPIEVNLCVRMPSAKGVTQETSELEIPGFLLNGHQSTSKRPLLNVHENKSTNYCCFRTISR